MLYPFRNYSLVIYGHSADHTPCVVLQTINFVPSQSRCTSVCMLGGEGVSRFDATRLPAIQKYDQRLDLSHYTYLIHNYRTGLRHLLATFWARGGVVVKALRYKPAGRGFDSRWCHWNFSVT